MSSIRYICEQYLDELKKENRPTNTINNYSVCLEAFCYVCGAKTPNELNTSDLLRFEEYSKLRAVDSDSRKIAMRYLKALRYFLKWCEDRKISFGISSHSVGVRDNYLQKQLYESQRSYTGSYVSIKELESFSKYWQKNTEGQTLMALRNRSLIFLLGDAGLKVNEVQSLKIDDLVKNSLKIRENLILMSDLTVEVLRKYLYRRKDNAKEMIVGYSNIDQDLMSTKPLSIREIQRIVKNTSFDLGFEEKNITPQVLRNSRIIRDLINDVSFEDITQRYNLAKSNSSYQRFLKKAKQLSAIDDDWVDSIVLSKKLKISEHGARKIIKETEGVIKFRGVYYASPVKIKISV